MKFNKEVKTIAVDANIPGHITSSGDGYPVPETMEIIAATRKWWQLVQDFKIFISKTAWDEISKGDGYHVRKRQQLALRMRFLRDTQEVTDLANALSNEGLFRDEDYLDAMILANACVYRIDFLVTTNMKHLVNKYKNSDMKKIIEDAGYPPPEVIDPAEFLSKYIYRPSTLEVRGVRDELTAYRDDLSTESIYRLLF